MRTERDVRQEICEIGYLLYERKYIVGTDGNLSVRLPGNVLLCTPSGICKGELQPDQLLKLDFCGHKLIGSGNPSSELLMHLMVYRERPDIRAVVHAHPLTTVALTVAGQNWEEILIAEVPIHLGRIAFAPYATPGSESLAQAIRPFVVENDAIVMDRHGILTAGKTLTEAYHKVEWVEYAAEVAWKVRQLGPIVAMDSQEVEKLQEQRRQILTRWNHE